MAGNVVLRFNSTFQFQWVRLRQFIEVSGEKHPVVSIPVGAIEAVPDYRLDRSEYMFQFQWVRLRQALADAADEIRSSFNSSGCD